MCDAVVMSYETLFRERHWKEIDEASLHKVKALIAIIVAGFQVI